MVDFGSQNGNSRHRKTGESKETPTGGFVNIERTRNVGRGDKEGGQQGKVAWKSRASQGQELEG